MFVGEPGDLVLLVASAEPLSELLLPLHGTQLVSNAYVVLPMGGIDGTGVLTTQLPLGSLGGGAEVLELFAQPAVVAAGGVFLGGGSTTAILSAALCRSARRQRV